MRDHVFKPAGMNHTFIGNDLQPLPNLVSSYVRGYEGKWRNQNRRSDWGWWRGSGAVITTVDDMLQWDIALREEKVLSREWLEKAWTAYTLNNGEHVQYGYGWDINTYNNTRIVSHSGGIYGFATQSVHVPEKKLYILYVDFFTADPNIIPRRILSRMLNEPRWTSAPKGDANMADYTGAYQLHHMGSRLISKITDKPIYIKFTTSGDTLYVQQPLAERTFLRPAGKDRFLPGRTEDNMYVFNRDSKGNIVSMNVVPFLFGGAVSGRPNKKVAAQMIPTVVTITIDSTILKKYAGTYYRPEADEYFFILAQGNKLFGSALGSPQKFELLPVSEHKFVRKGVEGYTVNFKNDNQGLPVLTTSGFNDREFKKVDD